MTPALIAIGLAQGAAVGAAAVLVFSTLGVSSQMAAITGTRSRIRLYGRAVCLGVVVLTTLHVTGFEGSAWLLPILPLLGLLAGMYLGMLLSALAEVINIFPALSGKMQLGGCVRALVWALALGKTAGVLVYYFTPFFQQYGL